jgi:hypothetical protein
MSHSSLHDAILKNDLVAAQHAIDNGGLRTWQEDWRPCLLFPRSKEMIDLLLNNGVDINKKNNSETALMYYLNERKRFDLALHLIEKGADVNDNYWYSRGRLEELPYTTLECAADGGRLDVVKALFNAGYKIKSSDHNLLITVFKLPGLKSQTKIDILVYLLNKGFDVNVRTSSWAYNRWNPRPPLLYFVLFKWELSCDWGSKPLNTVHDYESQYFFDPMTAIPIIKHPDLVIPPEFKEMFENMIENLRRRCPEKDPFKPELYEEFLRKYPKIMRDRAWERRDAAVMAWVKATDRRRRRTLTRKYYEASANAKNNVSTNENTGAGTNTSARAGAGSSGDSRRRKRKSRATRRRR